MKKEVAGDESRKKPANIASMARCVVTARGSPGTWKKLRNHNRKEHVRSDLIQSGDDGGARRGDAGRG